MSGSDHRAPVAPNLPEDFDAAKQQVADGLEHAAIEVAEQVKQGTTRAKEGLEQVTSEVAQHAKEGAAQAVEGMQQATAGVAQHAKAGVAQARAQARRNRGDITARIRRIGAIIDIFCVAARVFFILNIVAGIAAIVTATFLHDTTLMAELDRATDNVVFTTLSDQRFLVEVPAEASQMIKGFCFALVQLFGLYVIGVFRGIVRDLTRSGRPFELATARRLRRTAWWLLPFLPWNPLVTITAMFFVFLISYLVEYGAQLQEKADETSRIQEELIVQFAEITENKSGQTGGHIRRVSEYTRVLADELGLSPEEVDDLRLASTMHDIGKLLVPTEILDKPGRLTDEEFAIIRQHTTYGGELLKGVEGEVMQLSRTIALDHHERWDGHGYAQGLAGEDISLAGRIVAVADVYDALTSRRSYKDAWDDHEAYDEIVRCSGTQFDPQVVDAFCRRYSEINAIRERLHDEA